VAKYKFSGQDGEIGFGDGEKVTNSSAANPNTGNVGSGNVGTGSVSVETKPVDKNRTKDKASTSKTFNQLVKSLYRSTMMAQQKVEELHIQNFITKYFDEDGHPNFVTIELPTNDHDGSTNVSVDVPLLTLAHQSYLNIKELEMEFEVELGHIEDIEDDNISAKVNSVDGRNMAKVKLSFNSEDPPEGIAKIRQELNKVLP